jgi:hypothetical protein
LLVPHKIDAKCGDRFLQADAFHYLFLLVLSVINGQCSMMLPPRIRSN